ncbi:tetratricopeptide repeat protein [Streptomyces sp. NPDC004327]|uniref:tetratricopeptide repeat protein n=1 Tax=Streptomyces sp. NPDC004327 TaxID=3364699 RepID=UPI00369369D2
MADLFGRKRARPGVEAGAHGVAVGGDSSMSAIGDNSVVNIHLPAQDRGAVGWPVRVGAVPVLASAFQVRPELRSRIETARADGHSAVLTQVLSGGGGVGKSQLAAAYAAEAAGDGVDLIVWVPAAEPDQVIARYAQAAGMVHAAGAFGHDAYADAQAFLAWCATTERSWLVVLDDITDPGTMVSWWPVGTSGWTLATTRLRDSRLSGGGRTLVDVGAFTGDEAMAYIEGRLTTAGSPHLLDERAADLAEALGCLPLALGHATAYMLNEQLTCRAYLEMFTSRRLHLADLLPDTADADGYGRAVTTTLLLALDAADAPLAAAVLRLAAFLDPDGHPIGLWETGPALDYLTRHRQAIDAAAPRRRGVWGMGRRRAAASSITPEEIQRTLHTLNRYSLLSVDRRHRFREVRIHALTARAARETSPPDDQVETARAAFSALLTSRFDALDASGLPAELPAVLYANLDTLYGVSPRATWSETYERRRIALKADLDADTRPRGRDEHRRAAAEPRRAPWAPAEDRERERELRSRLERAAELLAESGVLGDVDRSAVIAGLSDALSQGDRQPRPREADIDWMGEEQARTRWVEPAAAQVPAPAAPPAPTPAEDPGPERLESVIRLRLRDVAERERVLGEDHLHTLNARADLAAAYRDAGQYAEAVFLSKQLLADRERVLGPDHPDTIAARARLAFAYRSVGRYEEAIELSERVLADRQRLLGHNHPDTLMARADLAVAYGDDGRLAEALALGERVLADRQHVLGHNHPDTLTSLNNLTLTYSETGQYDAALYGQQQAVAGFERVLGPDHPDTLHARANLAALHRKVGNHDEADRLCEQVIADFERVLGPDDPRTRRARANMYSL